MSLLHVAVTRFFVTGAAALELFVQISWQPQRFRAFRADFVAGGSSRSRCGAVRIFSTQGEPSARFGRVESLWLWRGAPFSHAK